MMPKPVLGQYQYGPHGSVWGVWQYDFVQGDCYSTRFVCNFKTKEEAREFVYTKNNWKK